MTATPRQVYPSVITWALLVGALLWSAGADNVIPMDHRAVFYPFRSVIYLILASLLLSFIGAALVRKEQRDCGGEVPTYLHAYYAFFLICFTASVLLGLIMEGEHVVAFFRPSSYWWLLLSSAAVLPVLYSGAIAPIGSIHPRSYAVYGVFSVLFGLLSSVALLLNDSYAAAKWLSGMIVVCGVTVAYGTRRLKIAKGRVVGRDLSGEVFLAVQKGDLEALKGLVERGGDVNARHPLIGWTALQQAAYGGFTSIVTFLVEHGADVNATDAMGQTALRHAAMHCDLEGVKCLVEHGANVNATTSRGVTALAAAESGGRQAVVDYLKSKGAI